MEFDNYIYQTVDKKLVETIVCKLKSQGIFDQFRKDCLADVDTKPAYQNLQERVNGTVTSFLEKHKWQENLNKTQLRESLRRHVQQDFLETGVDRIVDQVVNPKIYTVFKPKVEDVVYDSLGIPKPNRSDKERNLLSYILKPTPPPSPVKNAMKSNVTASNVTKLEDLLPKDLDPISPGSVNDLTFSPKEDKCESEEGNCAETSLGGRPTVVSEVSNDSKLSISDLTSHESTKHSNIPTTNKSERQFDVNCNTDSTDQKNSTDSSVFENFCNLNDKLKQSEIKPEETDVTAQFTEGHQSAEYILEDVCTDDKLEETLKAHSEDSNAVSTNFNREKKLSPDDLFQKEEDNLLRKPHEVDEPSVLNNVQCEMMEQVSEKKEDKYKKYFETSIKPRSNRGSNNDKHRSNENRDYENDDRKVDKTRSIKYDKERKNHHDRPKTNERQNLSKDGEHDSNTKGNNSLDSKKCRNLTDIKVIIKENDNKPNIEKNREETEKPDEDRNENFAERSDKLETEMTIREDSFENVDKKFDIEIAPKNEINLKEVERLEKMKGNRDIIKEEKLEKHEKIKHKDRSLKDNDEKQKETKSKQKETEDRQRISRPEKSDKVRNGKDGEDKMKDQRCNKTDAKGKHKEELEENLKDEKIKSRELMKSKSCSTIELDIKENKIEDKSKDIDKDRNKKQSTNEKSRIKFSSGYSGGKNKPDKEEKKEKEKDRKRKGERCEEVKTKESRRSSDRDHNDPGSSSSGGGNNGGNFRVLERGAAAGSTSKNHESNQEHNSQGGGSPGVVECNDSHLTLEHPNDVDILLMKINDSIENDVAERRKCSEIEIKSEDLAGSSLKKPKIANNIFEIPKIIQARKNLEKLELRNEFETLNSIANNDSVAADPSNEKIEFPLNLEVNKELMEMELQQNNSISIKQKDIKDFGCSVIMEEKCLKNEIMSDACLSLGGGEEMEDTSFVVKKHRIANNIYEVRKIMHMKKRLEKKKKLALLKEEGNQEVDNEKMEIIDDNNVEEEKEIILKCDNYEEDNAGNVLEDTEKNSIEKMDRSEIDFKEQKKLDLEVTERGEINENENCPGDNAENEEPPPPSLKTPRIARNIYEVRKIIRARRALKRKLKLESKNVELISGRKCIKKFINIKRKSELLINKLKLLSSKDKRNRLKKESIINRPVKFLEKQCNKKSLGGESSGVLLNSKDSEDNGNTTAAIKDSLTTITKESSSSWQEVRDSFLGFTQDDIELALDCLKNQRELFAAENIPIFTANVLNEETKNAWGINTLDSNSNMVKRSNLERNKKKLTIFPARNILKLTSTEEISQHHDKVVQDILTGKNGCSIILTKSACLDEQAKNVVIQDSPYRIANTSIQKIGDCNATIDETSNISSDRSDKVFTPTLTEVMLDNLMKESKHKQLVEASEFGKNKTDFEQKDKKLKDFNTVIKCNENSKEKFANANSLEKGKLTVKDEKSNCTLRNIPVSEEEKPKRATRTSVRSTQRYDSTDLYKPRLVLSTRTRSFRASVEPAETSSKPNTCHTLSNLRRKVR